jgi:hypothetical protein
VFGIRAAATAIATGNTAILKGSELTPRCFWAVGKAFHEAGLPAGVLNVLSCPPAKAEEVVTTMIEVCFFLINPPCMMEAYFAPTFAALGSEENKLHRQCFSWP